MTAYDVAAWTLAYPEFPRNRVGPQVAIGVPPDFGGLLRLCTRLATITISGGSANSTASIAT